MTGEVGPRLLDVRGLEVVYHSTPPRTALRDVHLVVRQGEMVAVVGQSGSGKSTLAHAILRLLPAGGQIRGGRVEFAGAELTELTERELRRVRGRRIALIPQDPAMFLNPVQRIGAQVAEVLRIHRIARGRAAARQAVELLATAGLADPESCARRYPHQLSGGMRQRVLIAIALAGRPALAIADEPTSALDTTTRNQVLDHFGRLARQSGTAVLLITHDLGTAVHHADRVLVLHGGEIVEAGPAAEVLVRPAHPHTRALVGSVLGLADELPPVPPRTGTPRPLLVLDRVVRRFGERAVVDGVDLVVHTGETVGLVGASGSGKSTLARLATGLDHPTSGTVSFDGADLAGLAPARLRLFRHKAALVQQDPFGSLDPRWTVRRIVAEPLRAFRTHDRRGGDRRVRELVDAVGLPAGSLGRKPGELSGGQRQRVAIARALAHRPTLLVCDEPVSALDVVVQAQILDLLASLRAEFSLSCLFISHDLAVVRWFCDQVVVLQRGRIVESASAHRLFTDPRHPHTRELVDAATNRSRVAPAVLHPSPTPWLPEQKGHRSP